MEQNGGWAEICIKCGGAISHLSVAGISAAVITDNAKLIDNFVKQQHDNGTDRMTEVSQIISELHTLS